MKAPTLSRLLVVAVVLGFIASGIVVASVAGLPANASGAAAAPSAAPSASATPASTSTSTSTAPVLEQDTSQQANLAARVGSLEAGLGAAGVQPDLLHLPNLNEQPISPTNALITYGYTKAPAPMGVSYYGISQATGNGSAKGTVLDSASVMGEISVQSVSAFYMDSTSPDQWGAQLNALANNATLQGKSTYDYWNQNVIAYYGHNSTVQFVENTWNFSSSAEAFPSSGQSSIVASDTAADFNYEGIIIGEGPYFYAPAPFSITFYLNSSVVSNTYTLNAHTAQQAIVYAGDQELWYNYTFSDATTHQVASGAFDWIIFNSTNPQHTWTTNGPGGLPFEASGTKTNAATGLAADYEMDLGIGAFDGATQNVFNISATATEAYAYNTCSGRTSSAPATCARSTVGVRYQTVPAAYNAGSQTGETTSGISVGFSGTTAIISAGPSIIHGLWNYTGATGVVSSTATITNAVTVSGSPLTLSAQPYIFLFLESTNFTSQGYQWTPDLPSWTLMSGVYNYEAMLSDYQEQTGTVAILTTPKTLTATLPYATTSGVYTPLWAFSNAQLAGISSSGAGTITSQYTLFNNPTVSCTLCGSAANSNLSATFYVPNDYDFPTYSAIQLMNTSAYVNINNPASTAAWSGSTHAYLQMQFYEVSDLTLSNGTAIRGLSMPAIGIALASQNILPQAAVTFWNSSNNLIEHNTFVAQKALTCAETGICSPNENLLLYSAPGVHANNVVWGNTFLNPPGVALGVTYGGISVAENGDTIYNNFFDIDNPVVAMFFNIYTELCYTNEAGYCTLWPYVDNWNVANQSAANAMVVNGFTLSGSITGSAFQGGNLWWNYGNSLNAFTTTPYVDTFAYTDLVSDDYIQTADSASIYGVGDQVVILPGIGANPGYLYTTTIFQSGLAPTQSWTVTVTGTVAAGSTVPAWTETIATITHTQTGPSSAPIVLPQGTYTLTITGPAGSNPTWNATGAPSTLTSSSSNTYNLQWQQRWVMGLSKAGALGLASGQRWYVNFTGPSFSQSVSGTGNSLSISLPNGSFVYTVQVSKYAVTPAVGTLFVAAAAQPSAVVVTHFTHIVFQASFNVAGLPSSTSYKVWVNGSYHSASSPTAAIAVGLPNGTYNFTVFAIHGYTATPVSGNIVIAGANVSQTIAFRVFAATVTFTETGLSPGTPWAVSLGGVLGTSTSTTVVFSQANGSYLYSVGVLSGGPYSITPSSGSVTVTGTPVNVGITIATATPTYSLYFTESNLPAGTSWSVTVDALSPAVSTSSTIVVSGLAAGAHTYTIGSVDGGAYTATPSSGSMSVGPASSSVGISFSPVTYAVTFTESGLAPGTTWAIDFGGSIFWSSTTTITFQVSAGSYNWYIGYISGYPAGPSSGSTTVTNSPVNVAITFT